MLPGDVANSIEHAAEIAKKIGYPVILRPAFTLGGTGGGFADNETELRELMRTALELSPVHQVLVEKSIKGFKEIEFEVMRDANDTVIAICSMENLDPVGVHTGDSIVVAPAQTLSNKEYQLLRDSALKLIRALKIEGDAMCSLLSTRFRSTTILSRSTRVCRALRLSPPRLQATL